MNLNDQNFRIAFAFENKDSKKLITDSRYVRWMFLVTEFINDQRQEKFLSYHECTEEDYAQFYTIKSDQESELNDIRANPDRGFFCLDWDDSDPLKIYGEDAG